MNEKNPFDRKKVKSDLKKYGKTMADLHRATDIKYGTMNHYLNGYRTPSEGPALKIEIAMDDFESEFLLKELKESMNAK